MPDTPQEFGSIEWIPYKYRELNDDDLSWFTTEKSRENKAFRKVNDESALDLSNMEQFSVDRNRIIYQKEY